MEHLSCIFARDNIPDLLVSGSGPCRVSQHWVQTICVIIHIYQHCKFSKTCSSQWSLWEKANCQGNVYKTNLNAHLFPLENGLSPVEMLIGKRLKTTLPVLPLVLELQILNRDKMREKE